MSSNIIHIHNKNNSRFKIIFFCSTLLFILSLINIYPQGDAGVNWAQATASAAFPARWGHTSVVYNDKMWVIGGYSDYSGIKYYNDVWYSTDGVIWEQATTSAAFVPRYYHTSVVYDNKMWVIGGHSSSGYKNDVWYSTDGATWSQATSSGDFSIRAGHTSVVHDSKMWVIGGYNYSSVYNFMNDIWYSTDGMTWSQATVSSAFIRRACHTSVVYNNKMWVIAGVTGNGDVFLHDVWYSSDGVLWTRAIQSAAFEIRCSHTSVVYDDRMWVIAGIVPNDVWYSSDGVTWTLATASASFPYRYDHTSVVYDDKMWVIGGRFSPQYNLNDVWYSPPSITDVDELIFNLYE